MGRKVVITVIEELMSGFLKMRLNYKGFREFLNLLINLDLKLCRKFIITKGSANFRKILCQFDLESRSRSEHFSDHFPELFADYFSDTFLDHFSDSSVE